MRYIIVDLEATCWQDQRDYDRMETIEIGAVELLSSNGSPARDFNRFIRPIENPELTAFCCQLTSIKQRDIDRAETFDVVFAEFLAWIGDAPFILCSWGGYDVTQFRNDCERHGIAFPETFTRHINLKKEVARFAGGKPRGMDSALAQFGIPLVGRHHRGIDDAYNIANLAVLVLPQIEASESR